MNFDDMAWLVTETKPDGTTLNYGPFDKDHATSLRDRLRSEGKQAEAWAAQAPDARMLQEVAS